ncbi:hypothetical protein [Salinicola sp. NYA28a]
MNDDELKAFERAAQRRLTEHLDKKAGRPVRRSTAAAGWRIIGHVHDITPRYQE